MKSTTIEAVSEFQTREEVAKRLRVKPQSLAVAHRRKTIDLPFIRIGTRALYRRSDVDRLLESQASN